MIWNDRVKKLRNDKNMTLKEVANKIGVTEATAQRYESANGIKSIPYDIIEKYAAIFDVSPSYIMGWEADDPLEEIFSADLTHKFTIERKAIENDRSLTEVEKSAKMAELKSRYRNIYFEYIPKDYHEQVQKGITHNTIQETQDYLIDDLVKRLYEIPPRQRMKVVDAILTLLDYPSVM